MKTKTQFTNRILSLVLSIMMVVSMLPASALSVFAADTTYPYAVVNTEAGTVTIDGTLGDKTTAEESDITALLEAIKGYVDSGITTIIVTGSNPAVIEVSGSIVMPAVSEAIYRLTGSGNYDENNPYNGKIDLILSDVKEILEWEFYQAYALNSITLPKVTTIGDQAFQVCYYLKQITFGSIVTSIVQKNGLTFAVGEKVDGCDLVLNCGQLQTESTYKPDLENNVWFKPNWGGDVTWKSITLTHTEETAATCTAKATCSVCGASYGELGAHTAEPTYAPNAGDSTQHDVTYSCCGATVTEAHTMNVATGKCVCGADMTVVATVTDGTNTYYAVDAATLNQAVTAILKTGSRTFTVDLPADAPAEMITAIRRAICDTEGIADGSIHLTLKGVTSIPDHSDWLIDGPAIFGDIIMDENGEYLDQPECVTQLASVNLPDVTEIGYKAFSGCENLVSVSAPKAQTIGASAFAYTALTSVEFPELETIPTDMFSGTWTLSSAKFPKVTTIEQNGLLIGALFKPENNPTPFPLELTAEGDITFNGSYHFNVVSQNYSGKVDLVLCCDKKDAVTFHDDGTATWQVRDDLSYTFKSITFKHSYVDGKCKFCKEDCTHIGGTATCTTQAVCTVCGESYGELGDHSTTAEGDRAATCTAPAYCSVCKSEYGELDPTNHASEKYTYTDNGDGTHSKVHECGVTVGEPENHTIENHVCTSCGAMEITVSFNAGDYKWKTGDQINFVREVEGIGIDDCVFTATVAEDGTVTWTADKPFCWYGEGEQKLFAAPNNGWSVDYFVIPEDQSTSEKLDEADLVNGMWVGTPTTDTITFNMTHRMAKVIVNYEFAEGVTADISELKMYSIAQICLFSMDDWSIKLTSAGQYDAWVTPYLDGNQFTAFIIPETYATGEDFIKITLSDGTVREVKMNKNVTFADGAEYTYKVVITADGAYLTCADECSFEYTANEDGTHNKVCSECGYVEASENHTLTYTANGNVITESCSKCKATIGTAAITAENATYNGTEYKTATVAYSEGWKGGELTISYANNTNAGTATASITIGEATATVDFTIEKATVIVTANAKTKTYGDADPELTYTVNGLFGDDALTGKLTRAEGENAGKYAITQGTLAAGDNYTISFTGAELTIIDEAAPTGEILIKNNGWKQFWNWISFGLFCKDNVDVTVTADGTGSGVAKVEYLLSNTALDENNIPTEGWAEISNNNGKYNFSIKPQSKVAVYVRITDEGGNETIINSEGIVVYEDSKAVDTEVTYTYKENSNKDIAVRFNGNTVKSIVCGEKILAANSDYTVDYENGKIVLTASYLDTLNAGDYTYTVSYNPMGFENSGVTYLTTTFILVIDKVDGKVSNINISGKTYDGTAVTTPTYDKLGNGVVTIEYKAKGADDSTYTTTAPKNAGDYVVRVTAAEGTNHKAASATAEFSITPASIENAEVTLEPNTVVYNGSEHKPAVTVTWNGITLTENTDYVVYYRNNVNASDATVLGIVYVVGTNNFEGSIEKEFEITYAQLTEVEVKQQGTLTYNGQEQTPVVSVNAKSVDGCPVTFTYRTSPHDTYGTMPGFTGVGTYTVYFKASAQNHNDYYGSFDVTIAKKAVTVTANDASKTYGDSDPALTYTHTELVGSDALVITVARASGENANTYTITASQTEGANPNYEITFKTGTFTIHKAALTVTAEDKTATYGDVVPNYTVKYEGFKNGDDKDDLGGALAFECDYAQFSDKGEYTVKASGYTSGNYTISYVDGKLTVNAKPITVTIQNATSVYGDTLADLKATDNGIVNGDANVYSLASTATGTSNVGKYAITGTALDSNYDVTFVNGEYEITKREITITVDAKNTVINTTLPTYTYKVEGLVGMDTLVTKPTLTCNANIAVIGEYDITAIGADAGDNYSIKYVPAKLTVLTDNAVDAAAGYTEELKDYDPATVTSEDKAELEEMLSEINTILADETTTDNGKKALEEVKEQVEKLIKEINDAAEAIDTENTEKVENVTPENVTPENKTDLEGAKADLEKALEDNGGNYTEDEKKAIEEEIKRIDDALEVIGNVEAVEEVISKLPAVDTVKPDDEEAIKAITDAQTAYNALSDYEKSLVDEATKAALDKLAAALVAYDIVEGDGSSWTEDSDHNITFVVNGLFSKFVDIKVDGKDVDKANYEVKAGSTIITLKASYLDTLAVGEHTITVVYTDGSTDGTFNVHAKANSPATGDDFNIALYGSLMVVSVTALVVLLLASKKRRQAR